MLISWGRDVFLHEREREREREIFSLIKSLERVNTGVYEREDWGLSLSLIKSLEPREDWGL